MFYHFYHCKNESRTLEVCGWEYFCVRVPANSRTFQDRNYFAGLSWPENFTEKFQDFVIDLTVIACNCNIVIAIGKIERNCNIIVIDIDVTDTCLMSCTSPGKRNPIKRETSAEWI